jgi:tRNA-dihydrouridine synthase A
LLSGITRHMLGLFHARPRAREWRRILCELGRARHVDAGVIMRALTVTE